jgi:hypothetical protein
MAANIVTDFTFTPDIEFSDEMGGRIEEEIHEELIRRGLSEEDVVTYITKVVATVTVKIRSNYMESDSKEFWDNLAIERRLEERGRQTRLKGVWLEYIEGCPHLIRNRDSVDTCQFGAVCVLELGQKCETFDHVLAEWKVEQKLVK